MNINIEISTEVFRRLQEQARNSGTSIETLAAKRLAEAAREELYLNTSMLRRWSNNGRDWRTISEKEIAESYRRAAKLYPHDPDEFALHPEDDITFEAGY